MKFVIFVFISLSALNVAELDVKLPIPKLCSPKKKLEQNNNINVTSRKSEPYRGEISFERTLEKINGIPPSFPIHGRFYLNQTNEVLNATIYVENIEISDYLDYTVKVHPGILAITINITFNKMTLKGEKYLIDGSAGDLIDLTGQGPFQLSMETLSVTNIKLHLLHYCIDLDDIKLDMQKMTANFQDLVEDSGVNLLLNNVIGDMGPDALQYFFPNKIMGSYILEFVEEYIDETELNNFMEIAQHGLLKPLSWSYKSPKESN